MDCNRPRGRPSKRWRYEIEAFWESVTWKQNAQDGLSLKSNAESFIQQVDRKWLNMMMMVMMIYVKLALAPPAVSGSIECPALGYTIEYRYLVYGCAS